MPITYDPGISYHGDQYLYNGISGLGQQIGAGLADFAERQRKAQMDLELQQREQAQYDVIMKHAREKGLITDEALAEYNAAPLKKKGDVAKGYAANIALDTALRAEQMKQPRLQSVPAPAGSNLPAQTVFTGQGEIVKPPFTPSQVVVPPAPGSNGQPVNAFMTSPNSAELLRVTSRPENAGKREKLDNGQTVIWDEKGTPHYSAPEPKANDNWTKLNDDLKASTGVGFYQWQNASGIKIDADGNVSAKVPTKDVDKEGNPITRSIYLSKDQYARIRERAANLNGAGLVPGGVSAGGKSLSAQDQEALDWALGHPQDPRAAAIKQKLGIAP